jgi:putative tryptophan/tyrosine transport system substrate-binding protein
MHFDRLRRREFITLLGGGAAAWPLAARAQQPAVPTVGFLRSTSSKGSEYIVTAFRRGLRQAGYVEGRNVAIEFRWGEDRRERLPELAADLVARQVAVIVANSLAAVAAKRVTATTPIVFVIGGDPIKAGLVDSMNRPGGNTTGLSFINEELAEKRFALLHELMPKGAVIAVLIDPNAPAPEQEIQTTEAAARALGREIIRVNAATESELQSAFAALQRQQAGAVHVGTGAFFNRQREYLVALAARYRLASSHPLREAAEAGAMMSYGGSITDMYRQAGIYVARILKGEKAAELPVVQPTRLEFVINLKTANVLGLDVPPTLLARADEVIE